VPLQIKAKYGESIRSLSWLAPLGIVTCPGVDHLSLQATVASFQSSLQLDKQENSERIMRRIQAFDSFFAKNDSRSPLGSQFEMVRRKGLPPGNVLVQALLLSEMSTGLLMGAQDASAIEGELICELAGSGESFRGMRNEVQCRAGEIVLKDNLGIIASLLQGPDHRTRLKKDTKDVVFFVFSAPGITVNEIHEGTEQICSIFKSACPHLSAQVYEIGMPILTGQNSIL
jgi:DNA/RNA-binding domain of Phe-tRNA-synthetase-like protein